MLSGNGTTSVRKLEQENQKIPATGFVKTSFAHKAVAGSTGINLTALTIPTEMSANGFTNPPTAQLQAANLLFFQKNLTLVSSARGLLVNNLSYSVASSTQINFLGFTALEGEIFVGTIDYTALTSLKVVDARPINATGTLAAGTTDFNVGVPFKTAQYITGQIGAVLVYSDGVLQTRNSANSSTTLDGNYYEVDAGGGLGTIIRFNIADADNARNVMVLQNGLLSERPDGSMMAVIESVQGQVNSMAAYVASLAGASTTSVLGSAPTNVDLKAFGDRVLAVEQNRARIDLANTWTAVQSLPARVDGLAIATGFPGELKTSYTTVNTSTGSSGSLFTAGSLSLPVGLWRVSGTIWYFRSGATLSASPTLYGGYDTNSGGSNFLEGINRFDFNSVAPTSFSGINICYPTTHVRSDGTNLYIGAGPDKTMTGTTLLLLGSIDSVTGGQPQFRASFEAVRII